MSDLNAPRLCSFDGRMRVLTRAGLHPIKSLDTQAEAWSRNDVTGKMGFNPITAHYWNDYPDQVHVVMRDVASGAEQTIISNRIHPYFVQTKRKVANSSEGHVYAGVLDNGHWVDAQHLVAGDRLLNSDESWSEVVSVAAVEKPIKAYNLTVANDHTYFIAGAASGAAPTVANDNALTKHLAKAVWVHNDCDILWGPNAQKKLRKHAADIYKTAKQHGATVEKGDWEAAKKYIGSLTIEQNKRNEIPFPWNTEVVNGYVSGDAVILTKPNGEFLTFLHAGRVSSYLEEKLKL